MVTKPKNRGGLGVINLRMQNEALLFKNLHKFFNKSLTMGEINMEPILLEWQDTKHYKKRRFLVEKHCETFK
jgi:hypothetical protein